MWPSLLEILKAMRDTGALIDWSDTDSSKNLYGGGLKERIVITSNDFEMMAKAGWISDRSQVDDTDYLDHWYLTEAGKQAADYYDKN